MFLVIGRCRWADEEMKWRWNCEIFLHIFSSSFSSFWKWPQDGAPRPFLRLTNDFPPRPGHFPSRLFRFPTTFHSVLMGKILWGILFADSPHSSSFRTFVLHCWILWFDWLNELKPNRRRRNPSIHYALVA